MSDFIVTKPFLRGSVRLRRGESLPAGVDGPTLADYRRLGMVAPAETKPGSAGRNTRQPKGKPEEHKPAAPSEHKSAVPSETYQDGAAASATEAGAPASLAAVHAAAGAEG